LKPSSSPIKIDYQGGYSRISPIRTNVNGINPNGTPIVKGNSSQERTYNKNGYSKPNNLGMSNPPNHYNYAPNGPNNPKMSMNPNPPARMMGSGSTGYPIMTSHPMSGYKDPYPPPYYNPTQPPGNPRIPQHPNPTGRVIGYDGGAGYPGIGYRSIPSHPPPSYPNPTQYHPNYYPPGPSGPPALNSKPPGINYNP